MKRASAFLAAILIIILISACQSSETQETEIQFQKGEALFSSPTPPNTRTPEPTAVLPLGTKAQSTPIIWPEPYNGGTGPTPVTPVPTPFEMAEENDKITFLLIGADRSTSGYFRTDTLILAIYFPDYQAVNLISIPRDLYVYIPGWTMNRINAAYAHGISSGYQGGGPQLLADTILYNMGIAVDHYALVDFTGFQDTIDTLGGIDVNVLCPYTDWHLIEPDMDPEVEENWELVTIESGTIHMDGFESLWYARSRMRSDDFDRGRRQQEILRAIYDQVLNLDILLKLPDLYNELYTNVEMSLGLEDLIALAPYLVDVQPNRITHYYIDRDQVNGWTTPLGGSVQLPDPEPFAELLEAAVNPPAWETVMDWEYEITIWNSSAKAGMEGLAVERLNYLGIAANSEVSGFGILSQTLLYVYAVEPDESLVERIQSNFNLSSNQIIYSPDPSSLQEYILVIGQDFNPCYYPNK